MSAEVYTPELTSIIALQGFRKLERKLRVAAYARVSTDKDDQANSYESQCKYFTQYIKQNKDWAFVGIYADEGISGTSTKKRDRFNQMIEDSENGMIDLIITKEVSRFARNTVDTLSITRRLKKLGVYVMFLNDNINTGDNDGELRLSIMATIAQDESRKTSERVKWGQKRRMEQGVVFGRDMLGYAVKGGKLYLIEDEAETVRKIFHKFTNEGKGTHVIARELREEGISPKNIDRWSNVIILRILRNEKYVGDLCQKKTYTPDYLTHEKKYNRGAEEKVYIKDHHPEIAIIDRDLWDRTQAELARRSPSDEQKLKHSNRYWCSGKLICGECGGRFVSRTKHLKNGTTYKAWRCLDSARFGNPKTDQYGNTYGCTGKSIGDRTIRELVAQAVKLVIADKDTIKRDLLLAIKSVVAETPKKYDKKKIEREIETLRKRKLRVIDLAASGAISAADMKDQNDYYTQQITALESKAIEADKESAEQRAQTRQIQDYIDKIDELVDCNVDDEATLHRLFDHAIVYNNNMVDLYLYCVPTAIRMRYKASGKMDYFKVEIESCELLSSDSVSDAQ